MKKQTKQIKRTNKKHESGRSMIEMVGVLAVMGLITAGAFVLITSAMRSQKLSRADDDISALAAGVRLLYNNSAATTGFAGVGSGTEADNATLVALGFDNVKPAYGPGSKYIIKEEGCTAASGNTPKKCEKFSISFDSGDADTCASLKARKWANGGTADCSDKTVKITFGYDE